MIPSTIMVFLVTFIDHICCYPNIDGIHCPIYSMITACVQYLWYQKVITHLSHTCLSGINSALLQTQPGLRQVYLFAIQQKEILDAGLLQADRRNCFSMMFRHTLVYNLIFLTRHTLTLFVFPIVHHAEVEQSKTCYYIASNAVHVI